MDLRAVDCDGFVERSDASLQRKFLFLSLEICYMYVFCFFPYSCLSKYNCQPVMWSDMFL